MPDPRVYKSPAIVLRHRKLGDADQILTLFTASHGKVDAVLKGARKTRSRMAGHAEPLTHATFMLAKGKTLDVVTAAETAESFQQIRDDLERLSRALYACELLDRFTEPHAEHFGLFRLLLDTLRRIGARDDADTPLRYYEMRLLTEMGYTPELDVCVACRARLAAETNYWSAGAGGVVCPRCSRDEAAVRPMSVNAVKLLRLLMHGRFDDVARVQIAPDLAIELERALGEYVRWVLERDIRSAAFIDTIRRRGRAARPRAAPAAAHASD
jgi:DNA repair protein RecO (recombination protein O)